MQKNLKIDDNLIGADNIAALLDEADLNVIGSTVKSNFEADQQSRTEWLEQTEKWLNLALQFVKQKSFPWPEAANVKYPLISIAALQFNARAYPALLPNNQPVKGKVFGYDQDGEKANKASRVASHMNYQLLDKMKNWEDDLDKLTISLPIIGTMFKKVCQDPLRNVPKTELLFPNEVVVNYWAKDGEDVRISHLMAMHPNLLKSYQNSNLFLDVDLASLQSSGILEESKQRSDVRLGFTPPQDQVDDKPHAIVEQHGFLDLDGDGYYEPYVITIHLESGKVLRIVARYSANSIVRNEDRSIRYIDPIKYFVKYDFFPSADGSYYGRGFGSMLGHLNETANTLINQLLDAGTLSNMQSGFLARGVRLSGGEKRFRPGEWKVVNSTGDDLKKGIFPMPVREPSDVLFKLLDFIVSSGKQLASISDTMTGEMPGQNTKATTTTLVVEQGMKVFNAIYKRIYRSLGKEFDVLFEMNRLYLPTDEEFAIVGTDIYGKVAKEDYMDSTINVMPSADPNVDSDQQAAQRAQMLLNLAGPLQLNQDEVKKRVLKTLKEPNPEALMNAPPPPPNPEIEFRKQELELQEREVALKESNAQFENQLREAQAMAAIAKAEMDAQGIRLQQMAQELQRITEQNKQFMAAMSMQHQMHKDAREADLAEQSQMFDQQEPAEPTAE